MKLYLIALTHMCAVAASALHTHHAASWDHDQTELSHPIHLAEQSQHPTRFPQHTPQLLEPLRSASNPLSDVFHEDCKAPAPRFLEHVGWRDRKEFYRIENDDSLTKTQRDGLILEWSKTQSESVQDKIVTWLAASTEYTSDTRLSATRLAEEIVSVITRICNIEKDTNLTRFQIRSEIIRVLRKSSLGLALIVTQIRNLAKCHCPPTTTTVHGTTETTQHTEVWNTTAAPLVETTTAAPLVETTTAAPLVETTTAAPLVETTTSGAVSSDMNLLIRLHAPLMGGLLNNS